MGAGDTTSHSFLVEGSSTAAGASLEPTTLFSLPTRDGERLKRLAGTGPQTKARTDINPVAVPTLVKWASTPPIFSCKTDMKDLEREEEEIRRTLPPPNPKPIP
jgi:hypothetical protein